jgi:phosphatidylglycerol lysyltransferase
MSEASRRRKLAAAAKRDWPIWLVTLATFSNGLVSVFRVLLTRFPPHKHFLDVPFPIYLYHWSRSMTLVLGFILLYLSFRIFQRRRIAWGLATIGSGLAILAHLGQWRLWYTASVPALTLVLLLVSHRRFSVRSEFRSIVQGLTLMGISVLIAVTYGTFGFWFLLPNDFGINFHLWDALVRTLREYSLWGNADLIPHTRHAVWFLESLHFLGITAGLSAAYSLFRPVAYRLAFPHERSRAKQILAQHGRSSYDYFKIWPEKSYFFSDTHASFIAYRTVMGVAICLGDPVGPDEELEETTRSFLSFCNDNGWLACFLFPDLLPMYEHLDLSVLKVGEEAVVDLEHFSTKTANVKYFRYVRRKFESEGYRLERRVPPHPPFLLDEAQEVSTEWLELPGHREIGFAQGYFERDYVSQTPLVVLRDPSGRLIAFVNEVPSYRPGEATFDMMRHRQGIPSGTMDYLFRELMLILERENSKSFNMGFAPFAGVGMKPGATMTEKAIYQMSQHLNWLVHAKGLRQFKNKFKPSWEDRFIVYQGLPFSLPKIAIALSRVL